MTTEATGTHDTHGVSRPMRGHDSQGFSLIELLIVIVVLGILVTVVVFSVRGVTEDGQDSSCRSHRRVLVTAIESYFASHPADTLPAMPPSSTDPERYERGLVAAHLMRDVSIYYNIDADGAVSPEAGSPCPA